LSFFRSLARAPAQLAQAGSDLNRAGGNIARPLKVRRRPSRALMRPRGGRRDAGWVQVCGDDADGGL